MTPSELLAWARATAPGRSDELLAHYAAHLQRGYSSAFMRDALRVALAEQRKLTPLKLDHQEPVT